MSPANITIVNGTEYFSCGANGIVSNSSSHMARAYQCGVYQGSVRTSSARKVGVSKVLMIVVFALFAQCINAIGSDISSLVLGQQQIDSYNLTYVNLPNDAGVAAMMKTLSPGDILVNTATKSSFELLPQRNSSYGKREPPECTIYKQVQIANSGVWWSPWYRIGPCIYTEHSTGGADYSMEYGYTYTWSIDAGPISWGMISGLIGGQWQKSVSKSSTLTCHIPALSKGSVWYQTQVLWGNAQYREVSLCHGIISPWSQYYHFDAPSRFDLNSGTVHLGCSTGDASGCD